MSLPPFQRVMLRESSQLHGFYRFRAFRVFTVFEVFACFAVFAVFSFCCLSFSWFSRLSRFRVFGCKISLAQVMKTIRTVWPCCACRPARHLQMRRGLGSRGVINPGRSYGPVPFFLARPQKGHRFSLKGFNWEAQFQLSFVSFGGMQMYTTVYYCLVLYSTVYYCLHTGTLC